MKKQYSILLVDDEPNVLSSLKRVLRKENYKVFEAPDAKTAQNIIDNNDIQLVISDQMMPEIKGTVLLKWVKEKKPHIMRILLTAYTEMKHAIDAINEAEVYRFMPKPWNNDDLLLTVERALERYEMLADLNTLASSFRNIRELLKKFPITPDEIGSDGTVIIDDNQLEDEAIEDFIENFWFSPPMSDKKPRSLTAKKAEASPKYSVLVIDDISSVLDLLEKLLSKHDYQVFRANDAYEALRILEKEYVHVIISDQKMPGMQGTEFFDEIREKYPYIIRILITAYANIDSLMEAINKSEIFHFVNKPFQLEELVNVVKRAVEYYQLRQDLRTLIVLYRSQKEILEKIPQAVEEKKEVFTYIEDDEFEDEKMDDIIDRYWID